ncbi:MAG: 34-kDa subunit of RNA polymerase III (C) [Chaenotheca gracillima]|nr:MAG: 34-kDa subunit of RNA polymerase III (C) [Chaenotheca gracillima]
MASSTPTTNDQLKDALYACCAQAPSNALLKQSDLLAFGVIPNNSKEKLLEIVGILLKQNLLQVYNAGGETMFKVVKKETAEKYQKLNQDEALIYACIESSGREGIWTRTLKLRTNIHQSNVTRALKSLEGRGWIRPVRSVKNPRQILYMLSSFTPSEDVTGGPWFTDGELDGNFVKEICDLIERYISSRSFHRGAGSSTSGSKPPPAVKRESSVANTKTVDSVPPRTGEKRPREKEQLLPFPPNYERYPTLTQTRDWLNASKITEVIFTEAHVERLLDVLYYDGRIEKISSGPTPAYKAVRAVPGPKKAGPGAADSGGTGTGLAFTEAPCGRCKVFHLCEEGGPVRASNCEYFSEWLRF